MGKIFVSRYMVKKLIFTILFFAACRLVAQDSAYTSFFSQKSCVNTYSTYNDWVRKTQLSNGEPYRADDIRAKQLLDQYSKVKLQMSLDEVEKILGQPDFGLPSLVNPLAAAPAPECTNEIAYIFEKHSDVIIDMQDVAVFIYFSPDNKLFWSAPLNMPKLAQLGSPTGWLAPQAIQQGTVFWKKYTFKKDGFAITLPQEPTLHLDNLLPYTTVYTVAVSPESNWALRVARREMDCKVILANLKTDALNGESNADPSSVKDVFINGFPGLEYLFKVSMRTYSYDWYYCVNGKFYIFSSAWSGRQSVPADVTRIVDSFHLLNVKPKK